MVSEQECYNALILSRVGFFHLPAILKLLDMMGSATEVVEHSKEIREMLPDASDRLLALFQDLDEPKRRAAAEMAFCQEHQIKVLTMGDEAYPQRLKECADAPIALFFRGNTDLNAGHVINIVGTRKVTQYGRDLISRFVSELRELCPETLIFSGLAYGVDIVAHRAALEKGFDTIGVLAHGLDEIYPRAHRETAISMIAQGGLLTEYFSHTKADKINFVRRNRIVAGCADATVIVESAAHGGGLITCGLARSYSRDVFAFPGAIGQPYSEGCNNLIRDNGAMLLTSAHDLVKAMGWENTALLHRAQKQGIERTLFPNLSEEELQIVEALHSNGDMQLSPLSVQASLPVARLSALLFEMEMKGVVRTLAGGTYHLLG